MSEYPTLSVIKSILQTEGLAPRKRLGQNFLIDANIARKSLELGAIEAGDCVVEIGPGLGALTQLLLEAGCHVHAIEMDRGLFRYLENNLLPRYPDQFSLLEGNALDNPIANLETPSTSFKIVANLPYAISTPWLDGVLSGPLPERMVLMLQKETAARFMAKPGSGNYGPISIFLNSAYKMEDNHKVSSQCFYPKPDVGSTLLSLKRLETPILFPVEIKQGIREIFRQRRKQISSIIQKANLSETFDSWLGSIIQQGINSNTRPEALEEKYWQLLAISP
jgi:16S rRNA (adenine1518-N6/adenine1519-N6)-dimethyltransferase